MLSNTNSTFLSNVPVKTSSSPIPVEVEEKEIAQLLKHVAYGEQDEAENILKKNSKLLLRKGNITDLSNRSFANITAFQYALWALDWHMWTMLLKYLPLEEARVQWQELDTHGTAHGKEVNWQQLLDAYETYRTATGNWSTIWCQQVGSAQFLLPAHVASEYSHPTRTMRQAQVNPELFTTSTRGGIARKFYSEALGKEYAWYRGEWTSERAGGYAAMTTDIYVPHGVDSGLDWDSMYDARAISALYDTRRQQKAELKEKLLQTKKSLDLSLSVNVPDNKNDSKSEYQFVKTQQTSSLKQTHSLQNLDLFNELNMADKNYAEGRTAFIFGENKSAITFFHQASTQYKRILHKNILDDVTKPMIEKRLNKLKEPNGKYALSKLKP